MYLTAKDVVRHPLVMEIIKAYEKAEEKAEAEKEKRKNDQTISET